METQKQHSQQAGLQSMTTYKIEIKAKDPVGNETEWISKNYTTTGKIEKPTITVAKGTGVTQNSTTKWYNGQVNITIKDSITPQADTGAKSISYKIIQLNSSNQETTTTAAQGENIPIAGKTITFNQNGKYRIKAWVIDKNNVAQTSKTATYDIAIDQTTNKPNPPQVKTITSSKLTETNSGTGITTYYCNANSAVTLTPGTDTVSGAYWIKYTVTGRNSTIGTQTIDIHTSKETTINITLEGQTTIQAWTIDAAGNQSQNALTIKIYRDTTKPAAPTIEVASGITPKITGSEWYNQSEIGIVITGGNDRRNRPNRSI